MTIAAILASLVCSQGTATTEKIGAKPAYDVVQIAMPPGAIDVGLTDLNNRGEVIFNCTIGEKPLAFIWRAGKSVQLRAFTPGYCLVEGLNDSGTIVGRAFNDAKTWVAVSWTLGKSSDLDDWKSVAPFALSKQKSIATAVDEEGNIAIESEGSASIVGPGGRRTFSVIRCLRITSLGPGKTFAGYEFAGWGHFDSEEPWPISRKACWGRDQTVTRFPRVDWEESEVRRGNGKGLWVGCFEPPDVSRHACIWKGTTRTDLHQEDWINSEANGVNEQGDVVGRYSAASTTYPGSAFLWRDGKMYDLNDCIPTPKKTRLGRAVDINDRGEILCEGFQDNGPPLFVVLSPRVKGK